MSCDNTPLVEALVTMAEIEAGEETAAVSIARGDHAAPTVDYQGETYDVSCVHPLHRALDFKRILTEQKIAAVILEIPQLLLPGNQAAYEVHVRAGKLEQAQVSLLSEWSGLIEEQEGQGELDSDSCPACGSHVPMAVEECPDCGLVLGIGGEGENDDLEDADDAGGEEDVK